MKKLFVCLAVIFLAGCAKSGGGNAQATNAGPEFWQKVYNDELTIEDVQEYLARGFDIDADDGNGFTLLWCALHEENLPLARFLIEHGADVNKNPDYLNCALDNRDITDLLIANGIDVNFQETSEQGPLFRAAIRGNYELVKRLIDLGDTNITFETLCAPLNASVSCTNGYLIVKLLLEHGAPVTGSNRVEYYLRGLHEGYNRSIVGGANNCPETAILLIDSGADIHVRDVFGYTPLHTAANERIIRKLVEAGADINATNFEGMTPVMSKALRYSECDPPYRWMRLLYELGADISLRSDDGKTVLHYAVMSYDKEKVRYLLSIGANPDARDNSGMTPLELGEYLLANEDLGDERFGLEKAIDVLKNYRPSPAGGTNE